MQVGSAFNACLPEANLQTMFITKNLMELKIPREMIWSLSIKNTIAISKKVRLIIHTITKLMIVTMTVQKPMVQIVLRVQQPRIQKPQI